MTPTRRASVALAAGSVVSGLLAYALFVLVTRGLGAVAAAPVSVLWTHWAFAGAAFTFPLQHWITRSVVAGHEGDVRRSAVRVAALVTSAAVVLGALAWLVRDRLFHRDDAWFPVMVVLVTLGAAAIGVVRGGLAGRGRFEAVAWSLVAENAVRCLLVGALLLAGVHDPVAHGLGLVAGSLVALWPAAWRFAEVGAGESRPLAFLGGAATGQLVGQGVLTGGPVLLALLGGSPGQVTAMFAALALFRAPYMVALGTLPQLTQRLTGHAVAGEVAAVRSLALRLAGLSIVAVPLAGAAGAALGPAVLRAVFGSTVDAGRVQAGLLAVGCTVAIVNLVLMVGALAHERPAGVAVAWGVAVLAGAGSLVALGALSPVDRSTTAFVVTELVATAALGAVAVRALRGSREARA
jgi:O-antigen/teichoic acid export membrane protein